MSHICDVIKSSFKYSLQKPFTWQIFKIAKSFWFSRFYSINYDLKECWRPIHTLKLLSDSQEMSRRSKIFYMGNTGSPFRKVSVSFLKSYITLWGMLTSKSYFVYHISNHVTERKQKSSYRFMKLFLWIYSKGHL